MGKVKKEMNLEDIKELLEVYSEPPADKRTISSTETSLSKVLSPESTSPS